MKAGLLPVRPYWWQKVVILAHITHEGSRTINGKRLCALIASWSRGAPTEVWSQLCYVWDKQLMRDLTISLGRTEAESINLLFSAFETRVQIRLPFAQTIHGAVRNGFAFSPVPLPVSGTDFSSLSVSTSMSSATLLIVQNSSKTCLDLLFISKCKFCSYSLQLWKLQCHVTKCGLFYSQWFSQILSIPLLPAILAHAKLSQSMLNSEYFFFNVFFFLRVFKICQVVQCFWSRVERDFLAVRVAKPLVGHLREMSWMLTSLQAVAEIIITCLDEKWDIGET